MPMTVATMTATMAASRGRLSMRASSLGWLMLLEGGQRAAIARSAAMASRAVGALVSIQRHRRRRAVARGGCPMRTTGVAP